MLLLHLFQYFFGKIATFIGHCTLTVNVCIVKEGDELTLISASYWGNKEISILGLFPPFMRKCTVVDSPYKKITVFKGASELARCWLEIQALLRGAQWTWYLLSIGDHYVTAYVDRKLDKKLIPFTLCFLYTNSFHSVLPVYYLVCLCITALLADLFLYLSCSANTVLTWCL